MPRKKTLKGVKKKLWNEVKKYVIKRDKSQCQKCGKLVDGANRHVSHVIPKSHGNVLRYDPNNLKILCFHDHINWWHKYPTDAGEWFKKKYPKRWEYIQSRRHQIVKWKIADYEEMIQIMKEKNEISNN